MKTALIGGTGFVGSYILDELIKNNITPRLLVRNGSQSKLLQHEKCELVFGDIENNNAVIETIQGCSAVIYNIGIIREFPANGITYEKLHFHGAKWCIDAAISLKINRFILMSANGVKSNGTGYQQTKILAEEYLKSTNLDYTIFRPSLVFGDPRVNDIQEFCTQLKKDMLNLPFPSPNFFPGFNPLNSGNFAMSPIHAKDVASIFVKSINEMETVKKTYNLGGKPIFWKDIIKIISGAYGKKKWTVPAPALFIKSLATILGRFAWFPITEDQITMLMEGNVCNSEEIFRILKIKPIPFNSESLSYLKD